MKTVGTHESGAIFSEDRKYRTRLWRCWNESLPRALFCLLNPSIADDVQNDATVERQTRRIKNWILPTGQYFGAIEIINVFALRSTDPRALYDEVDPVGPDNDFAIAEAVRLTQGTGGIVICGWGQHAVKLGRVPRVLEILKDTGAQLHAFKLSDDVPHHPLYIGYDVMPKTWYPWISPRALISPAVRLEEPADAPRLFPREAAQ